MKSVVYAATGDSSVLHLVERPTPEPGADEVRVRIAVSGINPTDWKFRAGLTGPAELAYPEISPGQDGAGVVDAVGEGVEGLGVGDRVWLYLAQYERPIGTATEQVVVPSERAVRLPDTASYDLGASLGVPALTAHRALTVHEDGPARLAPGALTGRTILVSGGAGAVGHAAIQLAHWAGATVISTVSGEEKAALARAAGADHVLTYTTGDPAAEIRDLAPDGVDLVVEVAIIPNVDLVAAALKPRGAVSVYANTGGSDLTLPVRVFMTLNARLQFVMLYTMGETALRAAAADVSAATEAGALEVGEAAGLPVTRFPLGETGAAHDAVEQGAVGKVLVDVAELSGA